MNISGTEKGKKMKKLLEKKQLRRLKLELQELLGIISIYELTENKTFTKRYEELHHELMLMGAV